MNLHDKIDEYNVRPTNLYGELKILLQEYDYTEKISNNYYLKETPNGVPVWMLDWHELWLTIRIIIESKDFPTYQVHLEKPFLGLKDNLLKSEDELFEWYKKLNNESQEFINKEHKFINAEYPFAFTQPTDDSIYKTIHQLLLDNRP